MSKRLRSSLSEGFERPSYSSARAKFRRFQRYEAIYDVRKLCEDEILCIISFLDNVSIYRSFLLSGDWRLNKIGRMCLKPIIEDNKSLNNACENGWAASVRSLLSYKNVDPSLGPPSSLISDRYIPFSQRPPGLIRLTNGRWVPDSNYPLAIAILRGHEEVVEELLEYDPKKYGKDAKMSVNPGVQDNWAIEYITEKKYCHDIVEMLLLDERIEIKELQSTKLLVSSLKTGHMTMNVLLKDEKDRFDPSLSEERKQSVLYTLVMMRKEKDPVLRALIKDGRVVLDVAKTLTHQDIYGSDIIRSVVEHSKDSDLLESVLKYDRDILLKETHIERAFLLRKKKFVRTLLNSEKLCLSLNTKFLNECREFVGM